MTPWLVNKGQDIFNSKANISCFKEILTYLFFKSNQLNTDIVFLSLITNICLTLERLGYGVGCFFWGGGGMNHSPLWQRNFAKSEFGLYI